MYQSFKSISEISGKEQALSIVYLGRRGESREGRAADVGARNQNEEIAMKMRVSTGMMVMLGVAAMGSVGTGTAKAQGALRGTFHLDRKSVV